MAKCARSLGRSFAVACRDLPDLGGPQPFATVSSYALRSRLLLLRAEMIRRSIQYTCIYNRANGARPLMDGLPGRPMWRIRPSASALSRYPNLSSTDCCGRMVVEGSYELSPQRNVNAPLTLGRQPESRGS